MPIAMEIARLSLHLFLLAALLPLAVQAQDAPPPRVAGTIELVEGLVRVEGKDKRIRTPAAGQTVLEGDTITTLSDSEVHLNMSDGALFMVRERTRVTITEYVADGGAADRSLMDLAEGALRAITGWIGAYNRNSYRIRTPLVTIGVRGTDHEPSHIPIGDPRGEPGSYDKVNEGSAFMETKQGIVEVPKSRVVFHSASARSAPRLLERAPRFYKAGRYEKRFVARAREVRKATPQRRFERQEFVRQHGANGGPPAPMRNGAPKGAGPPRDGATKARQADQPPARDAAQRPRQADKAFADKARKGDWQKPAAKPRADGRGPKDAHSAQKPNRP